MVDGDLPPLTDDAKDFLCTDPDAFRKIYGTHYVKGEVKGASIEMRLEVTVKNSYIKNKFASELEAKYSELGFSAEASASLE